MMRRQFSSITTDGSTNYSTISTSLTTDRDTNATCTTTTTSMETVDWGSKLETTLEAPLEKDNTINESDALIAKGVVRRLTDYPTLDDVVSDWGTEDEEIQRDISKSKTKNEGKKMKR
ncbi:hypothetical protein Tcan_16968 [Toxocara canis]|uniref:Uncharacterized protein n=2 Tax=Toxocara canis TaxID=6265 RepID=A0A0B2VGT0_TOXCA|nr:hypothetical protein Tcan_16968 [Toxocara canis]VDM28630.1 unnamed protein product [Toxocara canis]